MKKSSLLSIIIFSIGLLLVGIGGFYYYNNEQKEGGIKEKIDIFTFEKDIIELKVLEQQKIPITIIPTNYSSEIMYNISDNSIVEIVNNEYIKGIKAGTTVLNATIKDKIINLTIKVLEVDNLYLDETKIVMSEEEKYQLNVKGNFEFNKDDIKYTVLDNNIIRISDKGEIKALKEGTTTVFVTYNNIKVSVEVTVSNNYHKVTYDYNGIEGNKNSLIKCDYDVKTKKCKLQLPSINVSKEYKVLGWSTNKEGKDKIYKVNTELNIDDDITLYAIVSKYKNKFVINYDLNGATNVSKTNDVCYTDEDSCEIVLPNITRTGEGVNVIGWSSDKNAKEKQYDVKEKISLDKDVTLYAITRVEYTANFYKNGAKEISINDNKIWKDNGEFVSTSCYIYNTEKECIVVSPNEVLTKEIYEVVLGFNTNKSASVQTIGLNQQIKLNKLNTNYYTIIKIDQSKDLTPMSNYEFPKPTSVTKKKVLKVLIVDIDPVLTKGELFGRKCAGLTASACMGEDKQKAINELITDIEYSSHGIIDVQIVKTDKLNEFATHTTEVTLLDGTKSHRLDEDTWLDIKKVWDSWNDKRYKELGDFTFDYDYLINKLNLVSRRNNGEFNEVWLVNVDPTKSFESMMVGRSAYYINGGQNNKNCSNFRIMNVSTSRPDTNFECNGHAAEDILDNVFDNTLSYSANNLSIDSSNYNNLNLWQKFLLTEYQNKNKNTGLSGVGNVHFSPNSSSDYDWENYSNKVTSKWREWLNYPNLTNNPSTEVFSPSLYMNVNISGTQSAARLHHRWWFSLMPHVTGYTNDGYSNNWWDYLYLSDFITSVTTDLKNYTYNVGDRIDNIKIKLNYKSLKSETITISKYENNMIFSNKDLFSIDGNGKIVATAKGNSTLKYYRDGKSITINITIN